jgi:hypothetical protein
MKYAVEMGSGAMIYAQIFTKFGPSVQKLNRGWGIHRARRSHKPTLIFSFSK